MGRQVVAEANGQGHARADEHDALGRPRGEQVAERREHGVVLGDRLGVFEDEQRVLRACLPRFQQGAIPGREFGAGGVQAQPRHLDRFAFRYLGRERRECAPGELDRIGHARAIADGVPVETACEEAR